VWKQSPLHLPPNDNDKLSVAFISRNGALLRFLRKKPCCTKYKVRMFTTVHGHMLSFHDIILLDGGLSPFTVESYIFQSHAKKAYFLSNGDDNTKFEFDPLSPVTIETSSSGNQEPISASFSRGFPDFAELYEKGEFPAYAEVTERLITEANLRFEQWQSHLR